MQRRIYERTDVEWPAVCVVEQSKELKQTFAGEVVDVTPNGAFFSPHMGYVNNVPMRGNRYHKMFSNGDAINLTFGRINVVGRVVWKGESKTHKRYGVGLEFEP